jgi:hypothetical protein
MIELIPIEQEHRHERSAPLSRGVGTENINIQNR